MRVKAGIVLSWLSVGGALMAPRQFASASSARATQLSMSNRVSLGAGCYWGTEKFIKKDFQTILPSSIISGKVGFMNPDANAKVNPSYREVCGGNTGYVETYDVEFDGSPKTFETLLRFFFSFHDPTTMDRQGNDRGTQYASVIFCYDSEQTAIAERVKGEVQALIDAGNIKTYEGRKVTTAILPATKFYQAQEDHQKYLEKNPWGYCNHGFRWKLKELFQ